MPSRLKRRITLQDIAAHAKVSVGSVSSVLNNRESERRIPPETARLIREAATRLGYLPNISARRLRSSAGAKNSVLVALITSFEAPVPLINHFISAVHQASETLSRRDYSFSLMIEMFPAGRLKELPGLLAGDHFNAAILMNTVPEDDTFLARSPLPYPAVLVNRQITDYSSVVEEPGSGLRAADLLLRRKAPRLAVLHGSPLTQTTRHRVAGFLDRARQAAAPVREIEAPQLSESAAYQAVTQFLKTGGRCNGLYAVSDALALGAYRAIKEHGLNIPRDISVLGVGDYEIAPFFDPPLSAIGPSHKELAAQASRLLFQQLLGTGPRASAFTPLRESLRESLHLPLR